MTGRDIFGIMGAVALAVVIGMLVWWVGEAGKSAETGRRAELQADAERAAEQIARADQMTCINVQRLYVDGAAWHARIRNTCDKPTTRRVYLRLAFYDGAGYRDGFITFGVEPLAAGERARMDAFVPRPEAVSARVFAFTDDPSIAVGW